MMIADPKVGSWLLLPGNAPTGGYNEKLSLNKRRSPNGLNDKDDCRDDQNFYFRVRTDLDETGRVKSALYGKIYGPIRFSSANELQFHYYLNGTPNDTNLEWNVGQNLFKGTPKIQVIERP